MNFQYLFLRLFRHFMPESIARLLLKRRWIIRPGLESSDPLAASEAYIQALEKNGEMIVGSRILVFGYGGRFAVGVELLRQKAAHVILCDHFVLIDEERNAELLPEYADYLTVEDGVVRPRPEYITLLHGDIREEKIQAQIAQVDFVLSTSVYEHLEDVKGITAALSRLTAPKGSQLHFVDLRDHYFKYPFEMLTFPEKIWRNFLNPSSNLNRFRVGDYRNIFDAYFKTVEIVVLKRDESEFEQARARIAPEFLSGDDSVDSVELIYVIANSPRV